MTLKEFPQVEALSVHQKMELAEELWKSICADSDAYRVSEEEQRILEARWSSFLENPSRTITLDQLREELETRNK